MAVCTFQRTVYKSGGDRARSRVDYITRQGRYASPADARIQHQGLEAGTGEAREDLVYWRARNLPQWAKDDPVRYFSEAEKREGSNRVAYTEWRFSLPRELSHGQNLDLAHDILDTSFGATHPYVLALHDPPAADGEQQPHVHVIWSARTLDGIDRQPAQFFKLWQAKHPERGGAQKDPALNHFGSVKASRVLYCDLVNAHLEHHGHQVRLHPDRLVDRGFDRAPEPKLLPSDSNRLKYHYEVTPTMQAVFDHRFAREPSAPAEQTQAQQYWQARKVALGIHDDMPLHEQMERISAARLQAVTHAPERRSVAVLDHEAQTLTHTVAGLEGYVHDVQRTVQQEQRLAQTHGPYEWRQMRDAERVLAEGVQHGLPRDAEAEQLVAQLSRYLASQEETPQAGASLNVRLFREAERGRDGGLSW